MSAAQGTGGRTPKQMQRSRRRAARRAIAAARDLAADGIALTGHLLDALEGMPLSPGAIITSYESLPVEPDTRALNAALGARGHRVIIPVTREDYDLDWVDLNDPGRTLLGRDEIARAGLVLVPGLSVDADGIRLGQAGGCYDRCLPRVAPGVRIVALLHPGEFAEDALPADPWDHPVHAVLSATGLRWTGAAG